MTARHPAPRTCARGLPIPDRYVRAAPRTSALKPLMVVAAALRDYETDENTSLHEIAARYGVSYGGLRQWARVAGMARRSRRKFTDRLPETELIRTAELVRRLGSRQAAAGALGIHTTSVRDRLRSIGHIDPKQETA